VVCVLWIVLVMLGIVAVAVVIGAYVAYPHRGQEMPRTPWIGEAMRKGVDMLPTLDNQRERERQHH
jgi:hypothetical protein